MAPTITVRPLTEADIPQHVRLIRNAFHNANDACNRIMYPAGVTPDYLAFFTTKGLAEFRAAGPNKIYLGAFGPDASNGAEVMFATALWVLEDDNAAAEPETQTGVISSADPPPDTNLEAFMDFHGKIEECRPRIMASVGAPYWHLSLLATAPKYERRGAASALMAWGVERADADGRMMYIDAMEMGRKFYERWGFTLVESVSLDGAKWGVNRVGQWFAMVRQVGGSIVPDTRDRGVANGVPGSAV